MIVSERLLDVWRPSVSSRGIKMSRITAIEIYKTITGQEEIELLFKPDHSLSDRDLLEFYEFSLKTSFKEKVFGTHPNDPYIFYLAIF